MKPLSKVFIVFVLMCVSAATAYSQDCDSYLQQAAKLVSQKKYCDAKSYYQKYSDCNSGADVSAEIAMCEKFCKAQVMESEDSETVDKTGDSNPLEVKEVAPDVIILKNGDEVKSIVQEVGTEYVKYKKFDNQTGPVYNMALSEIFMIRYANGSKDVFNKTEKQQETTKVVQSGQAPKEEEQQETKAMFIWKPSKAKYIQTNILSGKSINLEIKDARVITPGSKVNTSFDEISNAILDAIIQTYGKSFINSASDVKVILFVQSYYATFYTGMYRAQTRYVVKIGEDEEKVIEQTNFLYNLFGYATGKSVLNKSFVIANMDLFQFFNEKLR